MYLVPIFSPECWQSVGSSALLSPPQERTVSRRRRETTKCASALNARMNSGNRTANHFAVFVQEPRHTISKPVATEIHEVRTCCRLATTTCAVCDAQKTEKRREFSGQDVQLYNRARTAIRLPPGQGCAPTPSTPCQMHVKKSLRASGKPSKSVAVIANVSEAR